MTIDRRNNPRYLFNRPVIVKNDSSDAAGNFAAELLDLNAQGARIACESPIPCPAKVTLEILEHDPAGICALPAQIVQSRSQQGFFNYILTFSPAEGEALQRLSAILGKFRQISDRRLQEAVVRKSTAMERRLTKPLFLKCMRYNRIEKLMERNQYFYMRELHSAAGSHVVFKGREMINLSSNNYLGLATHPKVKAAALRAMEKYGIGTGGSRILGGTMDMHHELEKKLAQFKREEDCIVFNSGYHANVGVISALLHKSEHVVIDAKCHASIIDGCFLSGASLSVFRHNDMKSLEKELKKIPDERTRMVIADGVYSMDGDIAPLGEIVGLAKKYSAAILLDDAHGLGVLGESGRGTSEHFGLHGDVDITIGTLSKALGGVGGFAVAKKKVIHFLKHNSRSFIFSTSLPPALLAASIKALEILEKEGQWIERLWSNISFLVGEMASLGLDIGPSQSAIIPIMIRDEMLTYHLTQLLEDDGIFVSPVAYPAVKRKESRLRISLMATHTQGDMQQLVDAMKKLKKSFPVIAFRN